MSTSAKSILLLGATFSTGNMGVGALAAGALAVIARAYPDARVSFLDYGEESTTIAVGAVGGRRLSVPLINLRFSWKVFLANNVAYLILLSVLVKCVGPVARRKLIARNSWLEAIYSADLAVAVSGGDSFSDIYGLGRFFYVTLPQLLVTMLGKPLILLPQTIGPFAGGVARVVARILMRHALVVYSRDHEGVVEIRDMLGLHGDDPKARFCFDMGFVIEARKPRNLDLGGLKLKSADGRPLIGVNVSGLLLMGGYSRSNMFALNVNYRSLVDEIITFLVDEVGGNVLLVPHVFGEHPESDAIAASVIYGDLKTKYPERLFCVHGTYDQHEIKYIIGLCDFFLGSRMHACIAGLSQSIPAVGIAYSQKFKGVLRSIGVGNLVADPRGLSLEDTMNVIRLAVAERSATRAHLQQVMPSVQERVLNLLVDMS